MDNTTDEQRLAQVFLNCQEIGMPCLLMMATDEGKGRFLAHGDSGDIIKLLIMALEGFGLMFTYQFIEELQRSLKERESKAVVTPILIEDLLK